MTKWVHIGLIVQYVADKKSKHFKEKFEVRKVRSRAEILCRNIDTRKEYEFHERDLRKFKKSFKSFLLKLVSRNRGSEKSG